MISDRTGRSAYFCCPMLFCTTLVCFVQELALGDEPKRAGKQLPPTYSRDVLPILQAKCQNCHRRHQVGPFALETYEQARKRAHDIASVTEERSMPPWKPTRGSAPSSSTTSR